MSETKTNAALVVGGAAAVFAGVGIAYTRSEVNPIKERLDSYEEDIATLAISIKNMEAIIRENSRMRESMKSVTKKVERLSSKIEALPEMNSSITSLKVEMKELLDAVEKNGIVVEKKHNHKKKKTKKKHVKKSSSSEEDSEIDDEDMDRYLSMMTSSRK